MAAVVVAVAPTAIARASVYAGSVEDPRGDAYIAPFFEDQRTPVGDYADARSARLEYDSESGRLKYSVEAFGSFLESNYARFSAAIGQTRAEDGSCQTNRIRGDMMVSGSYEQGLGSPEPVASASVSGNEVPTSAGTTQLSRDGKTLTLTVQSPATANRPYACVVPLVYAHGTKYASVDDISGFALTGSSGAPTAPANLVTIPAAPSLSGTSFAPGDKVSARALFTNSGEQPVTLRFAVITARRPGEPHHGGIVDNFTGTQRNVTLAPGRTLTQDGTLTLPPDAPEGRWEMYASWQDSALVWHEGPSTFVEVRRRLIPPPPTGEEPSTTEPPLTPGPPSVPSTLTTASVDVQRARPLLSILKRSLVLRGRVVKIRASCPGGSADAYTGRVRLKSARPLRVRGRRHVLSLGSRAIVCVGGETVSMPVRLSRNHARLVRRLGSLRVRVSVTWRDAAGRLGRTQRTLEVNNAP